VYRLTRGLVDFLLSDVAQAALVELVASDPADELGVLTRLRRRFTAEQAAALVEQVRLRRRAKSKFPDADSMLFTDEALQQATTYEAATYHAKLMVSCGCHTVADLGCGIGGDMLAMARAGLRVFAVEMDPLRARLAQANALALGLGDRVQVVCADWTSLDLPADIDAAFVDPSRRVREGGGTRRVFSLEQMQPPLSRLLAMQTRLPSLAVKTAPGIPREAVPRGAEVRFVALGYDLKEALLTWGDLSRGDRALAVVLPGPHELIDDGVERPAIVSEPQAVLYEPNPAILRAGLVRLLGVRLGAVQIDESIAYLTSSRAVPTLFARIWSIERHGPFHLKTLNRWLRESGVGRVVIKKRGSAVDSTGFARRLRTVRGGPERTVFLTRCQGKPWMILCSPLRISGDRLPSEQGAQT